MDSPAKHRPDHLNSDCLKGIDPEDRTRSGTESAPIFCSWCFRNSRDDFVLVRRNKTSRDEWECTACGGECFSCQNAGCGNMARGGCANMAGFSRMRCDRCRLGKVECERVKIRMEHADEHFSFLTEDEGAMRPDSPSAKLSHDGTPPAPLSGVSTGINRGCHQNDRTLADG